MLGQGRRPEWPLQVFGARKLVDLGEVGIQLEKESSNFAGFAQHRG